jgi:hypothetical protein
LRAYEVQGVTDTGETISIATTDTASDALTKLRDAVTRYRRVWVVDESGADVSIDDLLARTNEEHEG